MPATCREEKTGNDPKFVGCRAAAANIERPVTERDASGVAKPVHFSKFGAAK